VSTLKRVQKLTPSDRPLCQHKPASLIENTRRITEKLRKHSKHRRDERAAARREAREITLGVWAFGPEVFDFSDASSLTLRAGGVA
jgi:hypothetical protein